MPDPSISLRADFTLRRRAALLCAAFVVSLGIASCGPVEYYFIHPLATRADTLWRGVWVGTWVDKTEEQPHSSIDFDGPSGGRWKFSYSTSESEVQVRPVRIGDHWFADMRLVSARHRTERMSLERRASLAAMQRLYIVVRLDAEGESLTVGELRDVTVEELRRDQPGLLPSRPSKTFEGDEEVTSSTQEIREFLSRFGDVDSLFSNMTVLYRER